MSPNWAKTDETFRRDARFHVVSRLESAKSGDLPMGADISIKSVAGKLNRIGYKSFIQGLRQAKSAGNRNLELAHWLMHILQKDRTDLALTADHFKLDRAKLMADATAVVNGFRKNETEMPGISNQVADALDRGWHYATLLFGDGISHRASPRRDAEVVRTEARAHRRVAGIRETSRR